MAGHLAVGIASPAARAGSAVAIRRECKRKKHAASMTALLPTQVVFFSLQSVHSGIAELRQPAHQNNFFNAFVIVFGKTSSLHTPELFSDRHPLNLNVGQTGET